MTRHKEHWPRLPGAGPVRIVPALHGGTSHRQAPAREAEPPRLVIWQHVRHGEPRAALCAQGRFHWLWLCGGLLALVRLDTLRCFAEELVNVLLVFRRLLF